MQPFHSFSVLSTFFTPTCESLCSVTSAIFLFAHLSNIWSGIRFLGGGWGVQHTDKLLRASTLKASLYLGSAGYHVGPYLEIPQQRHACTDCCVIPDPFPSLQGAFGTVLCRGWGGGGDLHA